MAARCTTIFALAVIHLAAGPAVAAADAVPPALRACASVKKNSERLACYDLTMEQLASDSTAPGRAAEAMFGASAVHGNEAVKSIEREELTSLTAHVTALNYDGSGALIIDLDNGQQWRQTSGSAAPLLKIGHEVTISRAALNSFRMSTPSGRPLKVKRIL